MRGGSQMKRSRERGARKPANSAMVFCAEIRRLAEPEERPLPDILVSCRESRFEAAAIELPSRREAALESSPGVATFAG